VPELDVIQLDADVRADIRGLAHPGKGVGLRNLPRPSGKRDRAGGGRKADAEVPERMKLN
jgi:hypothetical protein